MRKEKNGRAHKLIVILLLLVILLLAAIACALSLRLYKRSDPKLPGRWEMELELTDAARARGEAWLRAAALGERVELSLPRLTARVELRLNEDGTWSRSLDSASLDAAREKAERGLLDALRELVRLRLADAGRPVETDAELESRMEAAAGMPMRDYLAGYAPALLPTADELREKLDGGGVWQSEGVHIRFDGQEGARWLADDALLVLEYVDRTEVYRRA